MATGIMFTFRCGMGVTTALSSTLCKRRQNLSLGGVRQLLRSWIGRPVPARFPRLESVPGDRQGVQEAYRHMTVAWRHGYLEQERGVPAEVLSAPRFAGRVRQDGRGNAVFPHFDTEGLCGYEIKNRGFTGFAAGGEKGLWCSHTRAVDRRLVVTESAIDALSYASLFPDAEDRTRYASLGGKPSAKQGGLMQTTIAKLPEPAEIVAAFDADAPGRLLARVVCNALAAAVAEAQRRELTLKIHLPADEGEDWNDVLQRRIGTRKGASST
jgi:Toprim-like/Protein of unknown function (DUF3991)